MVRSSLSTLSPEPPTWLRGSSLLGQRTVAILEKDLGIESARISALREERVIKTG